METVWEYCVIKHPTKEQAKAGKSATFVSVPTPCLAETEDDVRMRAIREIPQEVMDLPGKVQVVVRPF